MAKIKLTKGELKKQRDSLKQFQHYLPTLQLKKQQLQMKILEAKKNIKERQAVWRDKEDDARKWMGLLADPELDPVARFTTDEQVAKEFESEKHKIDLKKWVTPTTVLTDMVNIAGANVPVFNTVHFEEAEYDFFSTPFWLDKGIEELRLLIALEAEIEVIKKQIEILEHELRITTQRVNLFEKVKIPECCENIRIISIYLGDQMANAVGISKVAKKKVEIRNEEEVAA